LTENYAILVSGILMGLTEGMKAQKKEANRLHGAMKTHGQTLIGHDLRNHAVKRFLRAGGSQ
jgi:hypothetical protein